MEFAEKKSKREVLALKMIEISQLLLKGEIPIFDEVADEFLEALSLFELAAQIKKKR